MNKIVILNFLTLFATLPFLRAQPPVQAQEELSSSSDTCNGNNDFSESELKAPGSFGIVGDAIAGTYSHMVKTMRAAEKALLIDTGIMGPSEEEQRRDRERRIAIAKEERRKLEQKRQERQRERERQYQMERDGRR